MNLIIDHLTEHGTMDVGMLYESPYTDFHPQGADGVFGSTAAEELVTILAKVRDHATG